MLQMLLEGPFKKGLSKVKNSKCYKKVIYIFKNFIEGQEEILKREDQHLLLSLQIHHQDLEEEVETKGKLVIKEV